MFRWYQESKICIAYLGDVEYGTNFESLFKNSVWFLRAWTLQELLAPQRVNFFDREWVHVGSKHSASWTIENVTGIPADLLRLESRVSDYLAFQKMTWASKRKATRPEDIAYSLMGIFDVNMPPLYGEGSKAFARLQEEIMKHTTDATFLHWSYDTTDINERSRTQLLASTPREFSCPFTDNMQSLPISFGLTNMALEINGLLICWSPGIYALLLADSEAFRWALLLRKYPWSDEVYKIGICLCERDPDCEQFIRKRRLTILRTPTHGAILGSLPEGFGFNICPGKDIEITPLCFDTGNNPRDMENKDWRFDFDDLGIKCRFGEPQVPSIAKMRVVAEDYGEFLVDVSFDFDCLPCALIYRGVRQSPVWELSESITKRTPRGYNSEQEMIRTHGAGPEGSYFIRSSGLQTTFAAIPEEFVGGDSPVSVWFAFIHPWSERNITAYWRLEITANKPSLS